MGKSTVFNALTHMRQHTGNWPGKTVSTARGGYTYAGRDYTLVDLPGTYSLRPASAEEEVTADYLRSGEADVTLVVADATTLERNLALALQVMETAWPVVVCVNLLDEAAKKHIQVDLTALQDLLGVPVVGTAARQGEGLEALRRILAETGGVAAAPAGGLSLASGAGAAPNAGRRPTWPGAGRDRPAVDDHGPGRRRGGWTGRLDRLFTSRATGIPVMLLMLGGILWLTMAGPTCPPGCCRSCSFPGRSLCGARWRRFPPPGG